ncbi:hypothetical protein PMAYCL1PPCAC_15417, partial [Pristionchus mayeri]
LKMEEHRLCLVCSAPTDSTHLGMDICRACASFYKRAKKTGATYPCRQGKYQCIVSRDNKFTCRRCRFDKCSAVGVVYDGPLRVRAKRPVTLLQTIEREFKLMIERRRAKELNIVQTHHSDMISHPNEELYIVNASCGAELFMIASEESLVFFNSIFPALATVSLHEKDKIFKDFVMKLSLIVSSYLTKKLFGDAPSKFMKSIVTYYDAEIPFEYYYPEDKGNRDFLESSVIAHTDDHIATFLPIFKRAELTEKEICALVAIVIAEHDLSISEETQDIMDEIRHEILENLQFYYRKELRLSDFSTRLGNLMSLNHTVQECISMFKVQMRFYTTCFEEYIPLKFAELSLD